MQDLKSVIQHKGLEMRHANTVAPHRKLPRTPHAQARGVPPWSALVPPPQRAQPARKSARCRASDGSPNPLPPCPRKTGSGPRLPAAWTESSWEGQRQTPDAPEPGKMQPLSGRLCAAPTACKDSF